MKSMYAGSAILFLVLSSCSAHSYKVNGERVTLYLAKPEAKSVLFFSSLNDYDGQNLIRKEGVWELTLPANRPFRYFYKVDGEIFLPDCNIKEKDDFGSENCIFDKKM